MKQNEKHILKRFETLYKIALNHAGEKDITRVQRLGLPSFKGIGPSAGNPVKNLNFLPF